jgi:mannose-6-phosphate isomerase-like protein (cupin superfamily)
MSTIPQNDEANWTKVIRSLERITCGTELLAVIIRREFSVPGIHFFTPDDFSQQLAYMNHPAGKVIDPHVHNPVPREVRFTQEVLLLKRGRLRVDFFDQQQNYLESRTLEAGDVILLAAGGHGFEALEEIEMIEVKQGPYAGDADKTRFQPVDKRVVGVE